MKPHRFLLLLLFSITLFAHAQERCAQAVRDQLLYSESRFKREAVFEQWMKDKLSTQRQKNPTGRTKDNGPYIIPVVVHVIHNGEDIGTGTNISDAQIQSQINVLNRDYQRVNADASNTPSEFASVAGSLNIQFVLAKQNPDGLTTNGILRVRGTKTGWTISDEAKLKSLSYWPSDRYLNIWVVDQIDAYIGYAQLPLPDGTALLGLEDSPKNTLTDGVVIDYMAFGSADDGNFKLTAAYNKGRTATHEIGHFFGLCHLWGNELQSDCAKSTDYVADTPVQLVSTAGCPSNPQTACTTHKMFQNYMDYTNDNCMNIFSKGQMERVEIVLNNSPRRKSLLTSPGTTPPVGSEVVYNLELNAISSPGPVICINNPQPVIRVRNKGNTIVTNFRLDVSVNNGATATQNISGSILLEGEEKQFTLDALTLREGVNAVAFNVREPNGNADKTPEDNTITFTCVVNKSTDFIPLRQNFNQTFNDWTIVSQNNSMPWTTALTNNATSLAYQAFTNTNVNAEAWLVSPTLDLSKSSKASLLFDVSYAMRGGDLENLKVLSSTDCGVNFSEVQYDRDGDQLTFASSSTSWLPSSSDDWFTDFIDLDDLAGKKNVRLAFVVTNRNGNNLYLDNLEFFEDNNSSPPKVNSPYYIYANSASLDNYKITFNLPDRTDVQVQVYNALGQKMAEHYLPNTLNQTYPLDFNDNGSGVYIVKTQIASQVSASRIYVSK